MNNILIVLLGNAGTDKLTPMGALIALIFVLVIFVLPITYLIVRGFIEDVKDGRYARRNAR